MVSRDGLEPSTHSLKETDTTKKISILNKKPLFEAFVEVLKSSYYVRLIKRNHTLTIHFIFDDFKKSVCF